MKHVTLTQSAYNTKDLPHQIVSEWKPEDERNTPFWEKHYPSMSKHLIRSAHYIPHFDISIGSGVHKLTFHNLKNLNMNWNKGLLLTSDLNDSNNALKVRLIKTNATALSFDVIRTDSFSGHFAWLWFRGIALLGSVLDRVLNRVFLFRPSWYQQFKNRTVMKRYKWHNWFNEHIWYPCGIKRRPIPTGSYEDCVVEVRR